MLTFEEKLSIIESFPELERKNVSLKRVNFHFEESRLDKRTLYIIYIQMETDLYMQVGLKVTKRMIKVWLTSVSFQQMSYAQ